MSEHFPSHLPNEQAQPSIDFHFEDIDDPGINLAPLPSWISTIIVSHHCQLSQLQYVFCSDSYLHQLNVNYLDHDTLTDIITFPYAEPPLVHGDIFISLERVKENAVLHNTTFTDECHRVIIHGALHLCGFPDKTPAEAARMRVLEDEALVSINSKRVRDY